MATQTLQAQETTTERLLLRLARRAASLGATREELKAAQRKLGLAIAASKIVAIAQQRETALTAMINAVREGSPDKALAYLEAYDQSLAAYENARQSIKQVVEATGLSPLARQFHRLANEVGQLGLLISSQLPPEEE
ncbi:MAG: hypothetical protein QW304_07720 [Thermoproteota archaeon]